MRMPYIDGLSSSVPTIEFQSGGGVDALPDTRIIDVATLCACVPGKTGTEHAQSAFVTGYRNRVPRAGEWGFDT